MMKMRRFVATAAFGALAAGSIGATGAAFAQSGPNPTLGNTAPVERDIDEGADTDTSTDTAESPGAASGDAIPDVDPDSEMLPQRISSSLSGLSMVTDNDLITDEAAGLGGPSESWAVEDGVADDTLLGDLKDIAQGASEYAPDNSVTGSLTRVLTNSKEFKWAVDVLRGDNEEMKNLVNEYVEFMRSVNTPDGVVNAYGVSSYSDNGGTVHVVSSTSKGYELSRKLNNFLLEPGTSPATNDAEEKAIEVMGDNLGALNDSVATTLEESSDRVNLKIRKELVSNSGDEAVYTVSYYGNRELTEINPVDRDDIDDELAESDIIVVDDEDLEDADGE